MRKPYHPDDSGMTWQNGGGNNNGSGVGDGFRIVTPGETRTLARDMVDEFGGSVAGWRRNINQRAPTFNFGGGHGNRNGGGNRPGGNNPGGGGDPTGGFDPSSPRNRMMPMAAQMPMQIPQQGLLSAPMPGPQMANPSGMLTPPAFPRDRSLLGVPNTQIPPQQQQGLLGDIPPEVLAFIRSGGMR